MTNIVILLTTVPVGDLGEAVARALVEERLAACVNVCAPMASVYRWDGHVARELETQLVIKTTGDRVQAVRQRISELHPYRVPEFLVCPVAGGSAEYLDWVRVESAPIPE